MRYKEGDKVLIKSIDQYNKNKNELWFVNKDYTYLGEMPQSLFPEITSESSSQMIEFKLL